ncbi:MAG TPA: BPSL0067 family protein [Kofleriaceae bacterium]|nr:BPSL0067 family protein [Kofleriaceae bacterium]
MKLSTFLFLAVAASAAGCIDDGTTGDAGADDPGAEASDATTAAEIASAGDHDLADTETMVETFDEQPEAIASSLHRIYATSGDLNKFLHGCFGGGTFDWSCSSSLDGRHADFTHKMRVGTNDTEVADNYGGYWGECVSLVKAATKNNTVTGGWVEGTGVFNGLRSGTAIATFSNGHYYGHTAIFLGYVKNSSGATIGIRVADQNWGARIVKRHVIYRSGSGVADADRYHAILVR